MERSTTKGGGRRLKAWLGRFEGGPIEEGKSQEFLGGGIA